MYLFVFMCLVLTISQQYAAGSLVPQYEYIKEADAWLRFHIVPATWQDASLRCNLEGGILASPSTSAMATAMTSIMKAHKLRNVWDTVFTGIHDQISKGEFMSLDGVPLADMPLEWAERQPSNLDNAEHCLALASDGTILDVSCGDVLPYFCCKNVSTFAAENGEMTGTPVPRGGNETANVPTVDWPVLSDSTNEIKDRIYLDWDPKPRDSTFITESTDMADNDGISQSDPVTAGESADIIFYDFVPHVVPRYRWNINKCATKEGYKWEPRTGSCYRFHRNSKSWYRALKTCQAEGGHLAVINSETESQVLKELFQINHGFDTEATNIHFASIGVWKMIDHDTQWLTIHGDTLEEAGFEKWAEDEPNNYDGNENCGGVSPDGLLNDLPCGNTYKFPFICEMTP